MDLAGEKDSCRLASHFLSSPQFFSKGIWKARRKDREAQAPHPGGPGTGSPSATLPSYLLGLRVGRGSQDGPDVLALEHGGVGGQERLVEASELVEGQGVAQCSAQLGQLWPPLPGWGPPPGISPRPSEQSSSGVAPWGAADQGVHPLSGQEARPDHTATQLLPAISFPGRNVLWAHLLTTASVLPLGPPTPLQPLSRSRSVFAIFPELPLWARPHAGHWACTKNPMDTLCPPSLVGETTWHPQGYGGQGNL